MTIVNKREVDGIFLLTSGTSEPLPEALQVWMFCWMLLRERYWWLSLAKFQQGPWRDLVPGLGSPSLRPL